MLLHRLGLDYYKPEVIPRKLDVDKQKAFISAYESLLNCLPDNEIVVFADAVHPTHAARPAGCWAPKSESLAIEQTSGRQRINIHGAIDLETDETRMIEAQTIDAASTIRLLNSIELAWPLMVFIHVYLDNARYHHARLAREWLERPGCRIKLRRSRLLPTPEPDRAAVGRHAQACHAQQDLRNIRRVRQCDAQIPARESPAKLVALPRFRHRQYSLQQSEGFSGSVVNKL